MSTEIEKAFDEYYGELCAYADSASEIHSHFVAQEAFAAGVDYATQKHIEMIKKMAETI